VAYEIRPLSFTEIVDVPFSLLWDRFRLLVGISFLGWCPFGVLFAVTGQNSLVRGLLGLLLVFVVVPVTHAALVVAVARIYLESSITVRAAYRAVLRFLVGIIGTFFLLYLLSLFAFLLLVLPGIYFSICWALVAPVIILENRFGFKALSRSRALIRGSWWYTFGLMLLVGLITAIPRAAALQNLWAEIGPAGPILELSIQAIAQTFLVVAIVIYYFDRRCRIEVFDRNVLRLEVE
jgi:hypothetical protein